MAYSLITHAIASSANGSSATTAGIDTTGTDLIVLVAAALTGASIAFSDSKGNTWSTLTAQSTSARSKVRIGYCQNPTVGSGHTFTNTASFPAIAVAAFSGSGASPFDVENGGVTDLANSIQPGSITPSQDNELLVTGISQESGTLSIDSGFAITDQTNIVGGFAFGVGLAYLIETTATAKNPTWTLQSSSPAAAAIASFKPGGGGGGVITSPFWYERAYGLAGGA